MKKWTLLLFTVLSVSFGYAQHSTWKEMEAFDEQVDLVLHPVEMGNLHPVKEKSGGLLTSANQWQSSAIPPDCSYPAIKTDLADLLRQCKELNDAILQKKTNGEIKRRAMEVHNKFHYILATIKNQTKPGH